MLGGLGKEELDELFGDCYADEAELVAELGCRGGILGRRRLEGGGPLRHECLAQSFLFVLGAMIIYIR